MPIESLVINRQSDNRTVMRLAIEDFIADVDNLRADSVSIKSTLGTQVKFTFVASDASHFPINACLHNINPISTWRGDVLVFKHINLNDLLFADIIDCDAAKISSAFKFLVDCSI